MIRNLSIDIFCISYMLGLFQFIPNYILVLIIFSTLFDAIALYFSNINTTIYNRNPDFKNIIKLGLEVTANSSGTTTVYFDGIRINDEDTFDANYGMISRSVLTGGNIVTKTSGRQVDIEYKLQLGF